MVLGFRLVQRERERLDTTVYFCGMAGDSVISGRLRGLMGHFNRIAE